MPRPANNVELTCEKCGKHFIVPAWQAKNGFRFCSQACRGRHGPVELTCERCGKKFIGPFWMIKKGRRFCSAECRSQDPMTALMSKISIDVNGCWNYTGFCGHGGYGQITCGGVRYSTHVLMWELHHGPVPDGQVVRHTCKSNPGCINPDHLLIGTPMQNVHDSIEQGTFRVPIGIENGHAKLDDDKVREIRKLRKPEEKYPDYKYSYKTLAKMFGVSEAAIWQVVQYKCWTHVV
jgi:hypothetical protein